MRCTQTGATAAVDTPEAAAIERALEETGWGPLTHILCTHHHADHTGGNVELKRRYSGCVVVGPRADAARIPALDVAVAEGEPLAVGEARVEVLDTPGHTRGHCAYYFPAAQALFCGDTLFSLGCGRLFEGTPEQMCASLDKLRALPGGTRVFCAHEYTAANARFALTLEPGNAALRARAAEVEALRAAVPPRPTVPSTLAQELAANPFLRAQSAELQAAVGLPGASPVAVFAETRRRKDVF